jgi:hypothetical protein
MTTGRSTERATLLAAIHKAMANGLLFGREFAAALFGIDLIEWKVGGYRMLDPDGRPVRVPACDFHLQQMALSPDPLAYVKKHAQL